MYRHAGNLLLILIFLYTFSDQVLAQNVQIADSTTQTFRPASIIKSLIIPGWGQLDQDRLWESTLFYFSTATFYYRTFFHYYHYNRSGSAGHLNLMKTNFSVATFLHTLNMIDITDAAIRLKPNGWEGGLLDDKPLKSPWGAALRSSILPGWGQVYVKSYWKAAGYLLTDGYLLFKAHEAELNFLRTGDSSYKDTRSKYRWYFGLAYIITIADAYASAHLYKFDEAMRMTVSPNISKDRMELEVFVLF